MKRILYVTIFITILLVSYLGITYSYEYNGGNYLKFELNGPSVLYVDVNTEYKEHGIKVFDNGVDISSLVNIDYGSLDTSILGEYNVKYEVDVSGVNEYVYRKVIVVDRFSPVIELNGGDKVYVILNGIYYDDGYVVNDNYDRNLSDKVEISGKVDTSKIGEYELTYSVIDSSGNKSSVKRSVIVKEPEITLDDVSGNRYVLSSYDVTRYSNTIVNNKWTDTGIYYEGYVKNNSNNFKIKLKNKDNALEYLYNMKFDKNNYYKGNINLLKIPNGNYYVYVVSNGEEKLLNMMDGLSRLVRARIGDKLISINYDNGEVNLIVNDFKYEYDILIDPGHGGIEDGAKNGFELEKNMNLKVSLYEKCRYESMGYRVYITRVDDTYGVLMGANSLDLLQRRSLSVGYYGTVSKVSYSNHHNASVRKGDYGFEILVSNNVSKDDLVLETNLYNKFKKYYNIDDNAIRLYSKDHDTSIMYNKLYGDVYSYKDYYAMIRIPNELFNVKMVIYEPIYMSNSYDFSWYWINKKWIEVSEIKIREYVNYLGGEYISDNSMCL